jgi:hypothetical protein
MRQHTSAYVSIRHLERVEVVRGCEAAQACVSIRQHTSAYVTWNALRSCVGVRRLKCEWRRRRRAEISFATSTAFKHASAYVQHASAYVSMRQHTSAYVSIRQHTSAYVRRLRQFLYVCPLRQFLYVCPHRRLRQFLYVCPLVLH